MSNSDEFEEDECDFRIKYFYEMKYICEGEL